MKKTILRPLEDRLLVDPDQAPDELGGIKLSEAHKKTHQPPKGTIIAVGPGIPAKQHLKLIGYGWEGEIHDERPNDDAEPVYTSTAMPLKPGDRIMYGAYANMEVQDPESKHKFLCLRLADVFVVLEAEGE